MRVLRCLSTALRKPFTSSKARQALAQYIARPLVLMNIGCDQATKHIARARLADRGTVFVVGSVFVLLYVENEGAFLSLGAGLPRPLRTAFIIIPLAALVGMIVTLARRRAAARTLVLGFSFIGLYLKLGLITRQFAETLLCWRHSGFSVDNSVRLR